MGTTAGRAASKCRLHGVEGSGGSGGNSQHPFRAHSAWAHLTLPSEAMGNGEDADALATALTVCASVWAEVLGIPPPEPTDGERLPTM